VGEDKDRLLRTQVVGDPDLRPIRSPVNDADGREATGQLVPVFEMFPQTTLKTSADDPP